MKISLVLCNNMHMDIERANNLLNNILLNPKYNIVSDYTIADIVIIMTCAFGTNRDYSMYVIADVQKNSKKESKIIVTGCLVKLNYPELAKIPKIHVKTWEEVKEMFGGKSSTKKLIKQNKVIISSGCSKKCSYCVYPLIDCNYVSKPIEEILKEVEELYDNESTIYLTGALETSNYGVDLYGTYKIAELLEVVCTKYPNCNYVLGWFHPAGLTDKLIDVIEKHRNIIEIMVHIQHTDEELLKTMKRPSHKFTKQRIMKLNEKRPDLLISTEVIVGFPGETEEKFNNLVEYLDLGLFHDIGVASYEPVYNTEAALIQGLPSYEVRNKRMEFIQKRYNCCTSYPAPKSDMKPILEIYLEANCYLDKLPNLFILAKARQKYQYIAEVDTRYKLPHIFYSLLENLLEEIKRCRDDFSMEKEKNKLHSIYTEQFRLFAYNVFKECMKDKEQMVKRFKKMLLDV